MKLHILAIGVHPDDVELGCSGTLFNHVLKGQRVGILDLTEGELGSRGSVATRYQESANAAKVLGASIRHNLQMGDGVFENSHQNRLKIIEILRACQPDVVLANALDDRHPDHGRAAALITDACFLSGLRKINTVYQGTEQYPWRPARVFHYIQDRFLEPDFIVDISNSFAQKIQSIKCYTTQFDNKNEEKKSDEPVTYISQPSYMQKIEARAFLLGQRIGVQYGEGFCSKNTIGISDLDQLLYPEIS